MEWVIGALIGVLTIGIQFYIWVWPRLRSKAAEKKEARLGIKAQLDIVIACVEVYDKIKVDSLEKVFKNAPISKKLYTQLNKLVKLVIEYDRWRHESWQVVNTEIRRMSEGKQYTYLNESLSSLVGGDLLVAFSGYDGHYSEPIYKAVYEGNLTFELAKNSFGKRRWEQSATVKVGLFKKNKITLTDVLETAQFHEFIEELQQLQERQCFKMLREVRKALIENAQAILKE